MRPQIFALVLCAVLFQTASCGKIIEKVKEEAHKVGATVDCAFRDIGNFLGIGKRGPCEKGTQQEANSTLEGFGQSGWGQNSLSQKGNGQNGLGHSGYGQNGLAQNGHGQSGLGQNGYGQNGLGQNGHGQSGLGQNGYGQNSWSKNGNGQNSWGQNGFGQNGYGQNGLEQTGYGQSGWGKNGHGQSGFGQSGLGQNNLGQTGFVQSGSEQGSYGSTSGLGQGKFGQKGYSQSSFGQETSGSSGIEQGTGYGHKSSTGLGNGLSTNEKTESKNGMDMRFDNAEKSTTASPETSSTKKTEMSGRRIISAHSNCPPGYAADARGRCRETF